MEHVCALYYCGNSHCFKYHDQLERLKSIESSSDHVISPLQSMEDSLQGVVNYFIMPVFAFANAGVVLAGAEGEVLGSVTFAVALGLVLGKFIGIFSFTCGWAVFAIKSLRNMKI